MVLLGPVEVDGAVPHRFEGALHPDCADIDVSQHGGDEQHCDGPVGHLGQLHTGDVGHVDKEGHLYITDRKKDLFKLSNGKYVAPQQIESLLKQSEFVSQVVVVGAGRKQPTALIVPEWEAVRQALSAEGEEFPTDRVALAKYPGAIKLVQSDVALLTRELADYLRIRRIALLPDEFTIDRGELTPTLKVKRRIIDQKFGDLIEELYS